MSPLYALLRSLLGLLTRSKRGEVTEIENAVLRHQLKVLRRQVRRPRFRPFDRVFLAAAGSRPSAGQVGLLPRHAPDAAPVAPRTRPAEVDLPHREQAWTSCDRSRRPGTRAPPRQGEPEVGVTSGSKENCGRSASGWARRPSEGCFVLTDSVRLLGARAPPGLSSCGPRHTASSPPTSSPWRRSG